VHVVGGALVLRVGEHRLGVAAGVPCEARKNAHCCDTRCACCMLCVTITIVTSWRSSVIVSSITRVDVGSSAEHGSSISSTFGVTASDRAMHSRCC
jgi:hypothetical protein